MTACLACGSQEISLWAEASDEEYCTTPDHFSYYSCNRCGALSIDPVPSTRLREIYPPNYYSFDRETSSSPLFRLKDWMDRRFFRGLITRLPQERLSVLDVGGGAGWQLSLIRGIDLRIERTMVVDIDPDAGREARKLGHEYFCGKFEAYASDRKFDVILMLNLVEHVDNPERLLTHARNHLSREGIIVIKTPNTDSLDARLFRHANWGGYHCPRHWVLFNRTNFETTVKRAGLTVRHFRYTQGAPFWTTSVLFALSRRGWIHVSRDHPVPHHPLYSVLNAMFAGVDLLRGTFMKTSQMFLVLGHADGIQAR